MGQYRTVIVKVGGKIPDLYVEMEPTELTKLLNNGYEIKEIHQIATNPAAGDNFVMGVIVLTYVLFKE